MNGTRFLQSLHQARGIMFIRLLALLLCIVASSAFGESFSCSFGKKAACLDYNAKVVDLNSVCFNQSTCGYSGFVCKSKLTELASEYETLVNSYNELLRKNKSLIEVAEELLDKNKKLVSDYNELLYRTK